MGRASGNRLVSALIEANKASHGLLPPSRCHSQSAMMVMCMSPYFAVSSVTFHTFSSQNALYDSYVTAVRSLGNKAGTDSIQTNFGDCSRRLSYGEVSWNHDTMHPKTYSLTQARSGMLRPADQAAGRVFCTLIGSEFDLVWTQDAGHLLGEMSGAPHKDALDWWRAIHHLIALSGSPMHM